MVGRKRAVAQGEFRALFVEVGFLGDEVRVTRGSVALRAVNGGAGAFDDVDRLDAVEAGHDAVAAVFRALAVEVEFGQVATHHRSGREAVAGGGVDAGCELGEIRDGLHAHLFHQRFIDRGNGAGRIEDAARVAEHAGDRPHRGHDLVFGGDVLDREFFERGDAVGGRLLGEQRPVQAAGKRQHQAGARVIEFRCFGHVFGVDRTV